MSVKVKIMTIPGAPLEGTNPVRGGFAMDKNCL